MSETAIEISDETCLNAKCPQSQEGNVKRKVKRSRNPDNWKKEKRKRAILSGQAYLNTKGELVGPRFIGPDCNCKHKCFASVSSENRLNIFNGYYSLKSYDEQNAYLYGLIRRYDIQRKRKPDSQKRTCSYKYYVRVKGKEIQVCKKAFAHIHGITDKKIRTLCIKHEQNVLFPRDNRGRHNNRPKKVTPELITLIKQHILTSLSGSNVNDYVKTDKNQLPDVNISKLHKNFLLQYQPEAIDKESEKVNKTVNTNVKSWLYFKVFHEEFNSLDFHTVKRRLSDLRKSLEIKSNVKNKKRKNGNHTIKKKKLSQSGASAKKMTNISQQNTSSNSSQRVSPCSFLASAQVSYPGVNSGLQQYTSTPHNNFQLGMLGLPACNTHDISSNSLSPSAVSQLQSQHCNITVPNGSFTSSDQFSHGHPHQSFPINFQPLNSHNSMSSYYLCLSRVSNLISLPVSCPSNTNLYHHQPQSISPLSTTTTTPSNHSYTNEQFSTFPNFQYQLSSASTFLHPTRPTPGTIIHGPVSAKTQGPLSTITQGQLSSSFTHPSIEQSYQTTLHEQSANVNLTY